ncbi:MAG: macrolide ABC transporter ATP-binding protein [Candidatus Portnoybacteria bacterium CG10_big_fil_rev_8_21_14_0_10_36_7]|uniref:Macrolide ABC transporter ATP-binding protein n=1 Tax=Candidatus Portnoybacteria bacterium CG10_big_fil_rev_8_21_14_0_10_36_7 TaxID=1974812 RepID=A0A2M8KF35_9BACT|nr:MAG: macrolide ABC transporter ATP-binding protein [Candidatus Portnoybacteria bacterium CG10_big_fil_rev_8_21_14_0_10_36_7]
MIKIENIIKEYQDEDINTVALNGINFKIDDGEFVAITGPSGSGKSTMMHILGLLDRPTKGKFYLDDRDTSKYNDEQLALLRNQKVGFIFQAFNLLKKTSIFDNVRLPLQYNPDIKQGDIDYLAGLAIEAVGITHRKNHLTNQLSGGEQQRAAIARALVNSPSLILADEPTGNLDTKNSMQTMDIFTDLNKKGQTIIIVTHEPDIAAYAKRNIQMKDGKIIDDIKT